MKTSLMLTLFLAGVAVLFVGLEDALIGETHSMAAGFDVLMNTTIWQADLARVT